MSLASALLSCIPPAESGLPAIGSAYGGGYFVGQLTIGGQVYNIIVAPKATGQPGVTMRYKIDMVNFVSDSSTNNGILIRDNMIAAGIANFPMQQWCNNLAIGGFTDWVLPPKDWMELAYRNLKPTVANNVTSSGTNTSSIPPTTSNYTTTNPTQTSVTLFRSGGAQAFNNAYYSTSTAGASASTMLLKRMTTGADYSEEYQYEQLFRAFRAELAAA